jgi:TatD DNase family protein
MLIDTHCHLAADAFAGDHQEVLDRAWQSGVAGIIVIGESPGAAEKALEMASADPRIRASAGVHPHDAAGWTGASADWMSSMLRHPAMVAAGEMGLDYHYDHSPRDVQRRVFEAQLSLATSAGRPAIIHAREADDDVAAILQDHPIAISILHSFSSGKVLLEAGLALGSYFSFSGMITFKNWQGNDAIQAVPVDRLLIETDAPYLAPVPYRGRRNEPAFVRQVAEQIAVVRRMEVDEVIHATGQNAVRVFGLKPGET